MRQERGSGPDGPVEAGRYLGHGLAWVASTLLFLLAGRALDRWLGTGEILAVLGAFIGAAAGFYSMYYHLVIEPRRRSEKKDGEE